VDDTLLLWINQGWAHPWLDVFFTWVSQRGTFAFPLAGVVLVLCAWRFGADGAKLWLTLAIVVGIADFTGNQIKHLTHQPRPCFEIASLVRTPGYADPRPCGPDRNAMPSNHATDFFAAAMFLAAVLRRRWVSVTMGLIAACVALSRIYLGKHYPSQVGAGILLGAVIGLVGAWTGVKYLAFIQRIRAHRP
jgi:membrane-associated phospholipid phosphatase